MPAPHVYCTSTSETSFCILPCGSMKPSSTNSSLHSIAPSTNLSLSVSLLLSNISTSFEHTVPNWCILSSGIWQFNWRYQWDITIGRCCDDVVDQFVSQLWSGRVLSSIIWPAKIYMGYWVFHWRNNRHNHQLVYWFWPPQDQHLSIPMNTRLYRCQYWCPMFPSADNGGVNCDDTSDYSGTMCIESWFRRLVGTRTRTITLSIPLNTLLCQCWCTCPSSLVHK